MSAINYDLTKIKSFIFDVDGVLSRQTVLISDDGEPVRTTNVRDAYAIDRALRAGYDVAVISGGKSEVIRNRLKIFGLKHVYMQSTDKIVSLQHYMAETGFTPEEIVYVGDDLPDYPVMKRVGLPIAPADAAPEIKSVSLYVSPVKGGNGVVRDVIEKVMKANQKWMTDDAFLW